MFKLAFPGRRLNFLRHSVVKLTSKINYCNILPKNPLIKTSQFYNNRRNNSSNSVRNYYEYPDVNSNEDETQTPYTLCQGAENRYVHAIMENNKSYDNTIVLMPNNNSYKNEKMSENELEDLLTDSFRLVPISTLLKKFRIISHHALENNSNIYDEKYENIINSIADNSKIFTDDQICHVLQSLMLWFIETNEDDTSFSRLYYALDDECEYRAKLWSVEKILLVCDHWYRLRMISRSKFVRHAIITLGQNPALISPQNLVQLLFYTSILRTNLINLEEAEPQLKSNFNNLDIDEIAIVALGFFKSQTMIWDRKLLAMIIQKTIEEIDKINEISLAAIFKIVRYSIHCNDLEFLCKLLENTVPQIPRLSISCLVHIIFAAAHRSLFYGELLNAVAVKFYRDLSKVRVKDIRCLTFALSSFNYVPEKQPDIFDRVIQELNESKRKREFNRYPKCFAACLHHLGILNFYPKNLIAQALDPTSIEKAYGPNANEVRLELLFLDLGIEAEIPDYRGPRLDHQIRENAAMWLKNSESCDKVPQLTTADHFMLDVMKSCEGYFGSKDMIHVDYILPQYPRPDIIICFDETNSPIPLSSALSKLPLGHVKHPLKISSDDGIKWVVLVIGSNNCYAKNTRRMLGHVIAKHRQLQHIGYKPFVICSHDWSQLRNDAEKMKYLKCKVFF